MHPLPRFALAARAAYYPVAQSQADFAVAGFEFIDEYTTPDGALRAIALMAEADLVLAIRGSDNAENWLTDARCAPTRFQAARLPFPVELHSGFLSEWLALRDWGNDVSTRVPEARRLVITGHSAGGSAAHIAATDIWTLSATPVVVYSYGAAKPGFGAFAGAYPKVVANTVRVVHHEDIVPTLPPLPGYQHACPELRLDDDGRAIGPVRGFFSRLWAWDRQVAADVSGRAEREHSIDRYVSACTAYAARFPTITDPVPTGA